MQKLQAVLSCIHDGTRYVTASELDNGQYTIFVVPLDAGRGVEVSVYDTAFDREMFIGRYANGKYIGNGAATSKEEFETTLRNFIVRGG